MDSPSPTSDVRRWVTPEVARALDSDGRFVFPQPARPILTPDQAHGRATESIHRWRGHSCRLRSQPHYQRILGVLVWWPIDAGDCHLERNHGLRIHYGRLRPDERVLVADSPLIPPPDSAPPVVRDYAPDFYLTPIYDGSVQVLIHFIPVPEHDPTFDPPTMITSSEITGLVWSVPAGDPRVPMDPESAVRLAARQTGARIAATPYLLYSKGWAPVEALWRLELDRMVRVRQIRDGATLTTRELYVGSRSEPRNRVAVWLGQPYMRYRAKMYVPHQRQPGLDTVYWSGFPPETGNPEHGRYPVPMRQGIPTVFDEVALLWELS